jgi:drug/metabolite transporter (DMT)-like permease
LAQPWVYVAVFGYATAFVTWMSLLQHAPIGPAFAISHLEVPIVMALAVPLFGEQIGTPQLTGAVAIVAGILCLALDEAENEADDPPHGPA